MKTFTTKRRNVEFQIDDDVFYGIPSLPAMVALELTGVSKQLSGVEGVEKVHLIVDLFGQFLADDSFKLFESRLSDKANPIDLEVLTDVIGWVLGEGYGLRPTVPPSSSGPGRDGGGTNSTDGALPAESTSSSLVGTDSLTSSTTA